MQVQNSISIIRYYQIAEDYLHQGEAYLRDGYNVQAVESFSNFIHLVCDGLPRHNSFRLKRFQPERLAYQRKARGIKQKLQGMVSSSEPRTSCLSSTSSSLRNLELPASLLSDFLGFAQSNTNAGIETCGILAGKLDKGRLRITHVIMPRQRGTECTCTTEAEELVLEVQSKYELITLGWIHTHPTQDCFLSSIDLHTQYGYQMMMPEALAIVLSPLNAVNQSGIFSLTERGMQVIGRCPLGGSGFHDHETRAPLFRVASHVVLSYEGPTAIFIDLR